MKKISSLLFGSLCAASVACAQDMYPVSFALQAPGAKSVAVAGEFNDWSTNKLVLKQGADGIWRVNTRLPAGEYAYKFIKDGQWMLDPAHQQRKVIDHIENSRLIVPMQDAVTMALASMMPPRPGQAAVAPAAPRKPTVPWDQAAYERAATKYNDSVSAYQKFLQTRTNPSSLRTIEDTLHDCVSTLEKYRDAAPTGINIDKLLSQCNKLIFDIHMTKQARL